MKIDRRGFLRGAATGIAGAAAAATIGFPHVARAAGELTVNSYGGNMEKLFRGTFIPMFEKEHNCKINLAIGLGKDWLAKFRAAGVGDPPLDVLMANETYVNLLRGEGFFEALTLDGVPHMKDAHPIARIEGDMGICPVVQPIGIAYVPSMVKTPPTAWKDFWTNPDLKGQLGMYTVTNSAGFMFLMMASKIFGSGTMDIDTGFREIAKLKPFNQVDFSGTLEVMLSRQEVAAGPLNYDGLARLMMKGVEVAPATPDEGVFMFEQVFQLPKGAKNKELGLAWIDFMLRPDVQEKWVEAYVIPPVNQTVEIPADLKKYIPLSGEGLNKVTRFDWSKANAMRDVIVERWNKEMT